MTKSIESVNGTYPMLHSEAEVCEMLDCSMTQLFNWRKSSAVGSPLHLKPYQVKLPDGCTMMLYAAPDILTWLRRNPKKRAGFLSAYAPAEVLHQLQQPRHP